jgi:hypothetical protein
VSGLAGGSNYTGGFSQFFTALLPNGMTPTPLNIQNFFCTGSDPGHGNICVAGDFSSGKSITSSLSGTFTASAASTANTPEPSAVSLGSLGIVLLVGARFLKSR